MILALHTHFGWLRVLMDITNAFPNAKAKEEQNILQPEVFVVEAFENFVCRLHQTLYGSLQSHRESNAHIRQFQIDSRCKQSTADPTLCTWKRNRSFLILQ